MRLGLSLGVGFMEARDRDCEITDVLFGPFDLDPAARCPIGHEMPAPGHNRGNRPARR
jgi:hypothetical protein